MSRVISYEWILWRDLNFKILLYIILHFPCYFEHQSSNTNIAKNLFKSIRRSLTRNFLIGISKESLGNNRAYKTNMKTNTEWMK